MPSLWLTRCPSLIRPAQPAGDAPATRLAAGSLLPLSANVVQIVSVR